MNYLFNMIGNVTFLTAYITGNALFPQLLSEEEEKSHLAKLKESNLLYKDILGNF